MPLRSLQEKREGWLAPEPSSQAPEPFGPRAAAWGFGPSRSRGTRAPQGGRGEGERGEEGEEVSPPGNRREWRPA